MSKYPHRCKKGIRLWLEPERHDKRTGKLASHAVWVIRDGTRKRSTGCRRDDIAGAEEALAHYIAAQHQPDQQASTDPGRVLIADIINLYARDVAPTHARPHETATRLEKLLEWWANADIAKKSLCSENQNYIFMGHASDIRGITCRAFVRYVGAQSSARRMLEDLRAAANFAFKEGMLDRTIAVTLPKKHQPRERWITRDEAAKAIWSAWRFKEAVNDKTNNRSARATRKHYARFMIVALYSGTRKAAILGAAFEHIPGCGFIDLERGVYYRQPAGKRQTKKRQPPIPLPARLLSHLRRWRANGQRFVIEYNGQPVSDIKTVHKNTMQACGFDDVVPHTYRHTAATWAMQNGGDPWKTAGYLGMNLETLLNNYGHHHPDHLGGAGDAITVGGRTNRPRQNPDSETRTKQDFSRG